MGEQCSDHGSEPTDRFDASVRVGSNRVNLHESGTYAHLSSNATERSLSALDERILRPAPGT